MTIGESMNYMVMLGDGVVARVHFHNHSRFVISQGCALWDLAYTLM